MILSRRFKTLTTTFIQTNNTIRRMNQNHFKIQLNEQEERIANLLVDCAKWIELNPKEVDAIRLKDDEGNWIGKERGNEPIELRIAGGWVRDKLLGADSDDIDISIYPDPITGVKFASLLEKYLQQQGKSNLMGKLTAIEAKPEQSKHLETATAIVENLSIDFVHQRGQESYADNSRIPVVCFGTPLEDAERRDLTINALFYNLITREVEDHTQKGLNDLGLIPGSIPTIRTPLPPAETFKDDPLRVIRAVRVGAKLGERFQFAEDLQEAVKREDIRSALRDGKKIARDRVGIEVGKMLMGNNPFLSMQIIHRYNLHPLIFLYEPSETFPSSASGPSSFPPPSPDILESLKASEIVHSLLTSSDIKASLHPLLQFTIVDLPKEETLSEINHEIVKRFYLSAALLPLDDLMIMDKKKSIWLGEKVIRDGLKFKTSDKVWVTKAKESCHLLNQGVKKFGVVEPETSQAILEIALLLRNKAVHDVAPHDLTSSTRWNTSLFWSLVVDLCHAPENSVEIIQRYTFFIDRVLASHLDTRAFALPLLNGNEILDVIDSIKGLPPYVYSSTELSNSTTTTANLVVEPNTKAAPQTKRKSSQAVAEIAEFIVKWQLINPLLNKEDCKEWLKGPEKARVLEWVELYAMPVGKKGSMEKVKKRKQDV